MICIPVLGFNNKIILEDGPKKITFFTNATDYLIVISKDYLAGTSIGGYPARIFLCVSISTGAIKHS